jgi:hypothetical protein
MAKENRRALETSRYRRYMRKQLVLPTEHGSWSWLLVPYLVGVLVAGDLNLGALLVLVGGLAGFLIRQPASVYMRARTGRGRKSDGPLAFFWLILFNGIALANLAGLLIIGLFELLWMLIPMAAIFFFYLFASRQRRASVRSLWMEVAGAIGLAAMAPTAYIAARGGLDQTAWILWALMAGQNILGVLYVRVRIGDTHERPRDSRPVLAGHAVVLAFVVAAGVFGQVSWLVVLPFVGLMVRAVWVGLAPRPVPNIKRFGFIEIGVEIAGGLLIAAGWF